jgi:hypothetical protein
VVSGEDVKPNGMTCEIVWREISSYVDGEVGADLRVEMDQHIRGCRRCTSVLEGTRNVIRLYGDEQMIEAPAGFGKRLEKRLARSARVSSRSWSSWSAWLVPVAAVVLLGVGLRLANTYTAERALRSQLAQAARAIPPDLQVVVSDGAKVFHVPGCDFIHNKNKVRTMTAKEAIRDGYVPCSRCMRKYLEATTAGPDGRNPSEVTDADADDVTGGQ